jgi:hypothetical protein
MQRAEREFLSGFERAAVLAQRLLACPPAHTSAVQYLEDVADLLEGGEDLIGRGLAVGCLAALGKP